jgi:hypothetical protein
VNKQAIEIAALLVKWRRKYEGKQCAHTFTDVIIRGGPRVTYETVSSSARRCEGRYEVAVRTFHRWEPIQRKELVWLSDRGYEHYEDMCIGVRCPVCGEGQRSEKVVSDTPVSRECKDENFDDIPF